MTVELDNRHQIDLDAVRRVAWQRETVALTERSHDRMTTSRAGFLRLLEHPDVVIYGVTSGYGQMAYQRFDEDQRRRHAARPPRAPAVSFGDPLPERVTRAIVLARLANYVDGHAAISPDLAAAVAAMLAEESLPPVPSEGNGGAGEIVALSQLFGPLSERVELREKDALALENGSPCAAALVADAALLARQRLRVTEEIFALAFDALQAPLEHLDPALDTLWGDAHDAAALTALRGLLAGADGDRRPYQAPVSFRILPRMLGRLRRALAQADAAATTSLQAVTDNPVYLPPDEAHPDGRILTNGGYHNTLAWPAMDELAATWADLCTLADRETAKLLYGPVSRLPDQLRDGPDDPRYLGCLPMTQVGYGEAARRAAQRTFLPGSESGGFGQNDVAAPHFFAWRGQAEAGRLFESALAPLAMVASQAYHATDRTPPPALTARLDMIRRHVPVFTGAMRRPGLEAEGLAVGLREEIYPEMKHE
ncbi:MAG: aromatic amino acid lyase [Halofilum sp. (in: g-proteobacteria)]